MAYTRHGHHILGTVLDGITQRPAVARCGGPARCQDCSNDVTVYYADKAIGEGQKVALVEEPKKKDHFECCSVPKPRPIGVQLQELTATQETMYKVYDALRSAGLTRQQALNAINEMQNAGIYFREAKDD